MLFLDFTSFFSDWPDVHRCNVHDKLFKYNYQLIDSICNHRKSVTNYWLTTTSNCLYFTRNKIILNDIAFRPFSFLFLVYPIILPDSRFWRIRLANRETNDVTLLAWKISRPQGFQ